jgi:hypothetical protein
MLKYFKKENKRTTAEINERMHANKNNKPHIYLKVDQEILREKLYSLLKTKTEFLLAKKYFTKVKFYYKCLKLKKKKILKMKTLFFSYLLSACEWSSEINNNVIVSFNTLQLIKVFANLFKITNILNRMKKLNNEIIFKKVESFYHSIRNKIYYKKGNFCKKKVFFYKITSAQFRKNIDINLLIKEKKKDLKQKIVSSFKRKFMKRLNKLCMNNLKWKFLTSVLFKLVFFTRISKKINKRMNISILLQDYKQKLHFHIFINKVKNFKKEKKETQISKSYFKDKLEMKVFFILKRKFQIISKFKDIVKIYFTLWQKIKKLKIVEFQKKLKIKISNLKKKYQNYKKEIKNKIKRNFYQNTNKNITCKMRGQLACDFNQEKRKRMVIKIMKNSLKKYQFLKMFIKSFKNVTNKIKIKNYLEIMMLRAKVKDYSLSFINLEMPFYIWNILNKKFEKRQNKIAILKIRSFFKIIKKGNKTKNANIKKLKLAEYFNHKMMVIRSFLSFNKIKTFKLIKEKWNNFLIREKINQMNLAIFNKKRLNLLKHKIENHLKTQFLDKYKLRFLN